MDLDQRKILSAVGDEGSILPKRLYKKLREALASVLNLADQTEYTKNVLISECFIRMFVETLGHYRACGFFQYSLYGIPDEYGTSREKRTFKVVTAQIVYARMMRRPILFFCHRRNYFLKLCLLSQIGIFWTGSLKHLCFINFLSRERNQISSQVNFSCSKT